MDSKSAGAPIPFNLPPRTGNEAARVEQAMRSDRMSGDGPHSRYCESRLQQLLSCPRVLLTPSCTDALELAALLLDVGPDDEVIMPSFTFVSTANAFALRGAKIVFVDIRPDTLNIDERAVEAAITPRTRVIVPVHYAGVGCEMDELNRIAERYRIHVVEDAAQAIGASYKGRPLGSFGALAALSFHETKNVTSGGEGGALLINDPRLIQRAEILREKGTNRSQFFRGQVDKYTWVDVGSSFLPSELQSAYLASQLDDLNLINSDRRATWTRYRDELATVAGIRIPSPPEHCAHNAHIFHVRVRDLSQRDWALTGLARRGIDAVFHYVPLHSTPGAAGRARFSGVDRFTTAESERIIRLPLWFGMPERSVQHVIESLRELFSGRRVTLPSC